MPWFLVGLAGSGLFVAVALIAAAMIAGAPLTGEIVIVAGSFGGVGLLAGIVALIRTSRQRRIVATGLKRCAMCDETMPSDAEWCSECGRRQGIDPLRHAVTRAKVGMDEGQTCPDCGVAFRLDRRTDALEPAPGLHRCPRCGSLRHGLERP